MHANVWEINILFHLEFDMDIGNYIMSVRYKLWDRYQEIPLFKQLFGDAYNGLQIVRYILEDCVVRIRCILGYI